MSEDKIFCKGGGCTAKLGPEVLERILPLLPRKQDKDLLVGYDHADDAAIYRLTEDLAIVQTLDFFPPMVEDPHVFGQIAAANALSDIYAMGKGRRKRPSILSAFRRVWISISWEKFLPGEQKRWRRRRPSWPGAIPFRMRISNTVFLSPV